MACNAMVLQMRATNDKSITRGLTDLPITRGMTCLLQEKLLGYNKQNALPIRRGTSYL